MIDHVARKCPDGEEEEAVSAAVGVDGSVKERERERVADVQFTQRYAKRSQIATKVFLTVISEATLHAAAGYIRDIWPGAARCGSR